MRMAAKEKRRLALALLLVLLVIPVCLSLPGCDSSEDEGGATGSSTQGSKEQSGDIEGLVDKTIAVGEANVIVRALEETFQPAQPSQRLSTVDPSPPGSGESLYQAYIRVQNLGVTPVRVDPADFVCLVGNEMVSIEEALSGPPARSILKNTSLDLVLTFKGEAGAVPELYYYPPWYNGTLHIVNKEHNEAGEQQSGGTSTTSAATGATSATSIDSGGATSSTTTP